MGFWNSSHNIGGAIAGGLALWGANRFFDGNIAGMFIFPAVIALIIGLVGLFWAKMILKNLAGIVVKRFLKNLLKKKI